MKNNNNKPTRRGQLIAGRILFLQEKLAKGEMSTKELYFLFGKDNRKYCTQLDHAVNRLHEKINLNKRHYNKHFHIMV